ncbi:MAG: sigma factor-like helix-turn-helix DNA-binding protein, partial [Blastocatellia bacterium]
ERPRGETQAADSEQIAFSADRLESADDAERIARCWSQLQPMEQQVLQLALQQNQSHAQISQSLGIPLGTVKSHARRGLLKLRDWLQAVSPSGETL